MFATCTKELQLHKVFMGLADLGVSVMVLGGLELARRGLPGALAEEERQEDLARFELHRAGVPPDYGALCRRECALHNLAGGLGLGLWKIHCVLRL